MNGTVVAIDPSNGAFSRGEPEACASSARTVLNHQAFCRIGRLAGRPHYQGHSVNLGGHYHMNLTDALAHSNISILKRWPELGFERVRHYANEFGLGELAGYNIPTNNSVFIR